MKTFDAIVTGPNSKEKYFAVMPYRNAFTLNGYTFAVHKRYYPPELNIKPYEHEWDVSEVTSGMVAYRGNTSMRGTISNAREILSRIPHDKFILAIATGIKTKGEVMRERISKPYTAA